MKINPEKIILESKDFHFKKKIFLISGNEETLIKKIQHILIQKIRNEGFGEIQKNVSKKINFDNNNLNDSLFFKSKIISSKKNSLSFFLFSSNSSALLIFFCINFS